MLSPLATTAAKRYCSLPVEVASTSWRPAPGARKIKVGTTLTLKIGCAADQSWYNPHFENRARRRSNANYPHFDFPVFSPVKDSKRRYGTAVTGRSICMATTDSGRTRSGPVHAASGPESVQWKRHRLEGRKGHRLILPCRAGRPPGAILQGGRLQRSRTRIDEPEVTDALPAHDRRLAARCQASGNSHRDRTCGPWRCCRPLGPASPQRFDQLRFGDSAIPGQERRAKHTGGRHQDAVRGVAMK